MLERLGLLAALALLPACSGESTPDLPDGGVDAGGVDATCAAGEAVDGSGACLAAGVPADGCGSGFESDGDFGCRAILPADACAPGQLAVPGDAACHELAACGDTAWADIPIEPTTQFVDVEYTGGNEDGSAARPWTSIQAAIDAAAPGAIVAIAAGTYLGDLSLDGKAVRLWGRCPAMVDLVGATASLPAIDVRNVMGEVEVRSLALRGPGAGIRVTSTEHLLVDAVWLHDVEVVGLYAHDSSGPATVRIQGSLFEDVAFLGVVAAGATVEIEASALRDMRAASDGDFGFAVSAVLGDAATRSTVSLGSVLVERARQIAIDVQGSEITIEDTVVRDTQPRPDGTYGRAINTAVDTGERSKLTLLRSILERNQEVAMVVNGGDAIIEATVVRDTLAELASNIGGRGISLQPDAVEGGDSKGSVKSCLLDRNLEVGLLALGADVEITSTRVRATGADPGTDSGGEGIHVQGKPASAATVTSCVVEDSVEFGLVIFDAAVQVESTLIRGTRASSAVTFGDGIAMISHDSVADVTVHASAIEHSARAGILNFGGTLGLADSRLECNAIHLDAEDVGGQPPTFEDLGDNACGCGGEQTQCQVVSTMLQPPEPLSLD